MFILSSGMLIFRRLGQTNMPHSGSQFTKQGAHQLEAETELIVLL